MRKHRSSVFKMHVSNTLHNIKFVWESGLSTSNLGVCSHAEDWVATPIKLPRQQTCTKGFPYGFFTPCPQGCNPVFTRQSIVWKSGCTVRSKNNLLSKLLCCFVLTFTNVSIWHAHMTLKFTDEHWILCHYPCYGPVCTWTCPQCQLISAEISYKSGSPIVPKETSGLTLGSLGQAVDFGGAMEPVIRTEHINFINSMILRNCMKLQEPLCSYVQAS
jgi:hypothetical protein